MNAFKKLTARFIGSKTTPSQLRLVVLNLACVAIVSVSFKPSGVSARGHWAKRSKKSRSGGEGRTIKHSCSFLKHYMSRSSFLLICAGKTRSLIVKIAHENTDCQERKTSIGYAVPSPERQVTFAATEFRMF